MNETRPFKVILDDFKKLTSKGEFPAEQIALYVEGVLQDIILIDGGHKGCILQVDVTQKHINYTLTWSPNLDE